jgi:2-keto-4-pentenoate hydratase/2-oxohepta-3-ene-1,7-dioic acid hydratase in catechol pathway
MIDLIAGLGRAQAAAGDEGRSGRRRSACLGQARKRRCSGRARSFAIGLNYADHIAESKMGTPERQVWFTKAQTSVNGPHDPILIARNTMANDYEVELVAVIGKRAASISLPPMPPASSSAIAWAMM